MNSLVPIEQASKMLSPAMQQRIAANKATNNNFADGVRDAFPVMSIKGKVFRARMSGTETAFLDPTTKTPVPFLDVVLVNASPALSKSYYAKGYTEGDNDAPNCWSMDGVKPDASVANKISPTCVNCPMNAFGSRTTEAGKAAKACQDARRVAVVMPGQLDGTEQMLMLLRIPQSSLKNLKNYAELLARNSLEPGACITRLAFDYQEAFPKLLFNFVAPLRDDQFVKVIELAEAPNTMQMLQTPDFDTAPSTQPIPNASGVQGMQPQATPELHLSGAVASPASLGAGQPDPTPSPSAIITLPDGRKFNPATGQFVEEPKPEPVQEVSALITLPDGRIFNPATGQFVEAEKPKPAPEPEAPKDVLITLPDGRVFNQTKGVFEEEEETEEDVVDPTVITLPDGRFFNPATGKYVVSNFVGADELGATPAEKPKRRRRSKAEIDAEKAAAASNGQQPTLDLQANKEPVDAGGQAATGEAEVGAAPASLEALLGNLVPQG
jgi:hypothetical protein